MKIHEEKQIKWNRQNENFNILKQIGAFFSEKQMEMNLV